LDEARGTYKAAKKRKKEKVKDTDELETAAVVNKNYLMEHTKDDAEVPKVFKVNVQK
jgi:hypothetical protein